MNIQSVGIIGGTNGIGASFASYFQKYHPDLEIFVSGRNTKITNNKIVQKCDLVIFSVPISVTDAVIEEMIPHSRVDQIWADFTSIKAPFVEKMLKSKAEVVGMHPLFGPMQDIRGHKLFVCRSRASDDSYQAVKELFQSFEVIEKTPEEHDLLMGVVQNVSHFSDFVMGETLRRIGMDIEEILQYSTPSYRLKLEVMGRMFGQSADLYARIATENPKGAIFSQIFAEVAEEFHRAIQLRNPEALKTSFSEIHQYLGDDFCRAAGRNSERFMRLYAPKTEKPTLQSADVAIFGDRYSHTDEASYQMLQDREGLKTGYCFNIFEVFDAVESGVVECGIIPYENSTQGSVFESLDNLFTHESVKFTDLLELPIQQHLMGLPGAKLSEIRKIYSHPQALAQANNWIVDHMEGVELINTSSTTRAGQRVLEELDPSSAAIGSVMMAEGLELEILKKNLELKGNRTKFVLLEKTDLNSLNGQKGVSFVVWFASDRSGSLSAVLSFLAEQEINLVKLDSRRAHEPKYGGYLFFLDAEISVQNLRKLLPKLEKIVAGVKVLGSW